jgi:hypothetical protein
LDFKGKPLPSLRLKNVGVMAINDAMTKTANKLKRKYHPLAMLSPCLIGLVQFDLKILNNLRSLSN